MKNTIARLAGALLALTLTTGLAAAQSKVTIAIGGGACLCYLPTVLAKQLGEYEKAGLNVELVDLKGGSDALKAVLGGSADVVSGYFDHCVNLAAKKQELQAFVVYDRYPGLVLVVSPSHTNEIKSIKDLAGKNPLNSPLGTINFLLGAPNGSLRTGQLRFKLGTLQNSQRLTFFWVIARTSTSRSCECSPQPWHARPHPETA